MDTIFKDIKIFYSSVRDTVLQFNDDEIINKCMEIDELINMCSSYTMRGQILTQAVKSPNSKSWCVNFLRALPAVGSSLTSL